jgi:hypothetical protein
MDAAGVVEMSLPPIVELSRVHSSLLGQFASGGMLRHFLSLLVVDRDWILCAKLNHKMVTMMEPAIILTEECETHNLIEDFTRQIDVPKVGESSMQYESRED